MSSAEVTNAWSYTSSPPIHRDNFTYTSPLHDGLYFYRSQFAVITGITSLQYLWGVGMIFMNHCEHLPWSFLCSVAFFSFRRSSPCYLDTAQHFSHSIWHMYRRSCADIGWGQLQLTHALHACWPSCSPYIGWRVAHFQTVKKDRLVFPCSHDMKHSFLRLGRLCGTFTYNKTCL